MYDFDDDGRDESAGGDGAGDEATSFQAWNWKATQGGFLIARYDAQSQGFRYLQIGTGQWCSCHHATVFPLRSTADIYALEFGYVVGQTVSVIHRRF